MDFTKKHILITGGTSGIGRALLETLAKRGATKIAVVARKRERLEELGKSFPDLDLLCIPGDVSKAKDLDKAVEIIGEKWNRLDILINNAGVVSAGPLENISDEDIINQININLTGTILLTKRCLPYLKDSNEAAIVNISSGLGYIAWPFYSVYAAAKAGVRQFGDAMRRDLYAHPIHVMTVYPTATDTEMMVNAKVDSMDDAAHVAEKSIEGLVAREHHVIFGGYQRLKDIDLNFNEPALIDQNAIERYEALRIRTEKHRAM